MAERDAYDRFIDQFRGFRIRRPSVQFVLIFTALWLLAKGFEWLLA